VLGRASDQTAGAGRARDHGTGRRRRGSTGASGRAAGVEEETKARPGLQAAVDRDAAAVMTVRGFNGRVLRTADFHGSPPGPLGDGGRCG
jgi:hypothetical protein